VCALANGKQDSKKSQTDSISQPRKDPGQHIIAKVSLRIVGRGLGSIAESLAHLKLRVEAIP